jgi:hypothetical protein
MPNQQRDERRPKLGVRKPAKPDGQPEESLREQARTETEERPYLDTEGGE